MTYKSNKEYLNKLIKDYLSTHKYIIYHNVIDYNNNEMDSYIFEDVDEDVYPDQKFNYYILIEKRYYKLLKNKIMIKNDHQMYHLNNIAKFYKSYYNKEDFTYNSVKYVKIKLRVFSNTSRPSFNLKFWPSKFNLSNYPILSMIKFMAFPVKKLYSKMFYLDDPDFDDYLSLKKKDCYKIKLSDNLNLYVKKSYILTLNDDGRQTSKNKDKVIFDDMIDNFDDLVKNHHKKYYDEKKYLRRIYNCILEDKKYFVELEVTIYIYFRHIKNIKEK